MSLPASIYLGVMVLSHLQQTIADVPYSISHVLLGGLLGQLACSKMLRMAATFMCVCRLCMLLTLLC